MPRSNPALAVLCSNSNSNSNANQIQNQIRFKTRADSTQFHMRTQDKEWTKYGKQARKIGMASFQTRRYQKVGNREGDESQYHYVYIYIHRRMAISIYLYA
jgi:preprotein translocase subunit SecF